MHLQFPKLIITRRIWQLITLAVIVLLATLSKYYPLNPRSGLRWVGLIFIGVYILTYPGEERRAMKSADADLVINWNLAESFLFFLSTVVFFVISFIFHLSKMDFYAYFHTGLLGLLTGVAWGEFVFQNSRLKELDQSCQDRYWANYKDSIF